MATKERRKTPPGAPKYHRLTDEKRIIIEALRKEGCSKKHIAERVGCHPTTVWRELKRNVSKKGYRHKKAQGKANHRVAVKAAKRRRFTAEIWALAKDRLAKGWTFEQIHARHRSVLRQAVPLMGKGDEREPQRCRPESPAQGEVVRRHHRGGDAPDRLHAQRPPAMGVVVFVFLLL